VWAASNLLWSGAVLLLTAHGSALHAFLALKLVVPCVALLSGVAWPLIGAHPTSPVQWLALLGLGAGVACFQYGNGLRHASRHHAETAGGGGGEAAAMPTLGSERAHDADLLEVPVSRNCSGC
jgi:hypothetical protein